MTALNNYYYLTKPGIIYGNILTAIGGFLLASKGHVNLALLCFTLLGTSLVIGSACVINNYIDRDIDKKMSRTKKRALVSGVITPRQSIIFGSVLGILGLTVLALYTNWLVVLIGVAAFVIYVVLYGVSKRKSVHGTLIGSLAGAAAIIGGYCAVTGNFDGTAALLFVIMAVWQMPHFYAIAIYRFDDYKAAGLPVLPVAKGLRQTKIQMLVYTIIFMISVLLMRYLGYAGYSFFVVMTILSLGWIYLSLRGFQLKDSKKWARQMFLYSLIVLLVFSVMLSINNLLF